MTTVLFLILSVLKLKLMTNKAKFKNNIAPTHIKRIHKILGILKVYPCDFLVNSLNPER